MKASLEPYIYGDPPVTKLRRRRLSCGHTLKRAIVDRDLKTAWCWPCQKRVRMVRFSRRYKLLTRSDD